MRAEPSPSNRAGLVQAPRRAPAVEVDSGARDLVRFGRAFLAASLFGLGFWTALGVLLYRVLA